MVTQSFHSSNKGLSEILPTTLPSRSVESNAKQFVYRIESMPRHRNTLILTSCITLNYKHYWNFQNRGAIHMRYLRGLKWNTLNCHNDKILQFIFYQHT